MDRATFDRQLEKGFDAQEVSAELTPGATPVHVLTMESEHPEYRYLRLERCAGGAALQAAVAAVLGHCAIINPTGSGVVIHIPSIDVLNSGAAARQYNIRSGLVSGAAAFTTVAGFLSDLRYGPATTVRASGLLGVLTNAAGQGSLVGRVMVPAGDQRTVTGPWVLGPNNFLAIVNATVNEECRVNTRWWERAAEPGEVQGVGV